MLLNRRCIHIYNIVRKANTRAKLILKCSHSRNPAVLTKAFNTYIRLLLKYGISVWNPFSFRNVNRIESIPRSFTNKVLLKFKISYNEVCYNDRLYLLGLKRLEVRCLRTDFTELFKIIEDFFSPTFLNFTPFSNNPHT